jgi:hypothetical protein
MAVKSYPYFKEEKDQVIFTGNYMEVYIPRFYFDNEISRFFGDKVETLGVFNFKVFSSDAKKDKADIHTFKFPSFLVTKPTSNDFQELENLVDGSDETSFAVLKYYKGDIFIDNVNVQQKSDNTILFIGLLHSGKLPNTIPYDEVLGLELDNTSFNGVNLNVSSTVLELIISEIYRDKADLSRSFRFKAGKAGKVSMHDYKAINIKQISTFNSTFTGVTFEDIDYNLVASVNKTRYNKKESESPIEKTIKY